MAEKTAVLIGAGKIARGYVGELFMNEGYHVTFIHHRKEFVDGLREQGNYTVYRFSNDGTREDLLMTDFDVLCSKTEKEAYMEALVKAPYAAVVTFPGAFDDIAEDLTEAVRMRCVRNVTEPFAVLMCVNTVGPADYFKNKILAGLNEEEKAYFERYVGLVETLVMRLCTPPGEDLLKEDAYSVSTKVNPKLPVDIHGFKPGHVYPEFFSLEEKIPGKLVKKIWCGNLEHCCLAYYGNYFGHTYVHEAARDAYVRRCTYYAGREANAAVAAAYGFTEEEMAFDVPAKWGRNMMDHVPDPLKRVGADPVRKLGKHDRFIGPALLSLKMGKLPYFIAKGAACGFYFDLPEDGGAQKVQLFIKEHGIEKAISHFCGLDANDPIEGVLYQMILSAYRELSGFDPAIG